MTLVATDAHPIASEIGHGAMGLRDNLRPFSELVQATAAQRHVFLRMRGGKLLAGWTVDEGGAYRIAWSVALWIMRDAISVATPTETLVRVETYEACRATEGTYYYDPQAGGFLYAHLTGGANPDATVVMGRAGFWYGSHSVVHPTLGPEKLTNGALDTWASASDASGWTEFTGGGGAVAQDAGLDGSSYSAKCGGALAPGGYAGVRQGGMVGIAGAMYRVSGTYQTPEDAPGQAFVCLDVQDGAVSLASDGRSTAALGTPILLAATKGYARRFTFDFVCPSNTSALQVTAYLSNAVGVPIASYLWVDGLSVRRIWLFERSEPRLTLDAVPEVEQKRSDSFYGQVARGSGTITLANGDRHFEIALAALDWLDEVFEVYAGGRFTGGNEILLGDMWPAMTGTVTGNPVVSDERATIPFEDLQATLATLLPSNVYDSSVFPDLARTDAGRPRPLLFGYYAKSFRMARVARDAATGYGVYEPVDDSLNTSLTFWSPSDAFVSAYADETAATKDDAARRVSLSQVWDYEVSPAEARVRILHDVSVIEVTSKNNALDFDIGGAAVVARVAPGMYTIGNSPASPGLGEARGLLEALRTAMNAAAAGTYVLTYSETTHKATIAKSAGTLNLRLSTGANRAESIASLLGFNNDADRTGSLTYTGNNALFTDCDSDHVVRIVDGMTGAVDLAGIYRGASGALTLAADILLCLLHKYAGVPWEAIDVPSFTAARAATAPVCVGLVEQEELALIVERVENSIGYDLTFSGGKFYLLPRNNTVPANVIDLGESDFIEFNSRLESSDLRGTVIVGYDRDLEAQQYEKLQSTVVGPMLRFGRNEPKTFETYLTGPADAASRLSALSADAMSQRRRYSVRVKGKLFKAPLGAKVRLTRSRGLSATGSLSGLLCRILGKVDDLATHETQAELIEVV